MSRENTQRKAVLSIVVVVVLVLVGCSSSAWAEPGDLDASFGTDGYSAYSIFGITNGSFGALAIHRNRAGAHGHF